MRNLFVLCLLSAVAEAFPFPEESFRSQWDLGCPDWSLKEAPPLNLLKEATTLIPQIEVQKEKELIRVKARMEISPEKKETSEQLLHSIAENLDKELSYPTWVLPGINQRVDGGTYFLNLLGLNASRAKGSDQFMLTGEYNFKILWMSLEGFSSLWIRRELRAELPSCPAFIGDKRGDRFFLRMTPRPGLVDYIVAEIYIVKPAHEKESAVILLRLVAKPDSRVFALLPEPVLKTELTQRGRRLFENFADFRRLGKVP